MKTILLATFLTFASIVNAQDKKFTFGFQVGYSSSWTSEKVTPTAPLFNQYYSIGALVLGLQTNYKFNDFFSLQTEVQYSKKGLLISSDYNNDGSVVSYYKNRQYTFSYIGIPVAGKLNFTKSKMPFLLAGVSPSFNFAPEYSYDIRTVSPNSTTSGKEDIDNLKSFNMPLTFGIGAERPIGKVLLDLSLRYNIGLMESIDTHKISSFNILAGIRF